MNGPDQFISSLLKEYTEARREELSQGPFYHYNDSPAEVYAQVLHNLGVPPGDIALASMRAYPTQEEALKELSFCVKGGTLDSNTALEVLIHFTSN